MTEKVSIPLDIKQHSISLVMAAKPGLTERILKLELPDGMVKIQLHSNIFPFINVGENVIITLTATRVEAVPPPSEEAAPSGLIIPRSAS